MKPNFQVKTNCTNIFVVRQLALLVITLEEGQQDKDQSLEEQDQDKYHPTLIMTFKIKKLVLIHIQPVMMLKQ